MMIILLGYVAIGMLWVTMFVIHRSAPDVWKKAHRATWWLLLASILVAAAWFLDALWLSFIGMLAALTSVSFIFQVFTDWLKRRQVSRATLIVWFEWLFVLSITVGHIFVWAIDTLSKYSV